MFIYGDKFIICMQIPFHRYPYLQFPSKNDQSRALFRNYPPDCPFKTSVLTGWPITLVSHMGNFVRLAKMS